MKQRRVLIITYYWPPSGGSGVQRWLKFVKYLRRFGWEPVLYIPENPEYPALDPGLSSDIPDQLTVLRQPIWEPYSWYKSLTGRKASDTIAAGFASDKGQASWQERLARWIRGNLFIPDARRFWIRPSVRFLRTYLQKHPVEVILSSGPPHSLHLIAQALQKQLLNNQAVNHIPWMADFRDPWTQIYWFKDLHLSPRALRRHQQLEASVYRQADRLIVVSPSMLEQLPEEYRAKTTVITNGFDPDDFPARGPDIRDTIFRWVYTGTLVSHQNPEHLWERLGLLLKQGRLDPAWFRIQLVGKVDGSVVASIEQAGIASLVDLIPYVSHQEVIRYQQGASALLLLLIKDREVAKGVLTGKIFEYMATQHPIICLGANDSDAALMLQETGTGICIEYEDIQGLEQALMHQLAEHDRSSAARQAVTEPDRIALLSRTPPPRYPPALERYTRVALTAQLAELLRASVDQGT